MESSRHVADPQRCERVVLSGGAASNSFATAAWTKKVFAKMMRPSPACQALADCSAISCVPSKGLAPRHVCSMFQLCCAVVRLGSLFGKL